MTHTLNESITAEVSLAIWLNTHACMANPRLVNWLDDTVEPVLLQVFPEPGTEAGTLRSLEDLRQ